jgi:hypothetical protein
MVLGIPYISSITYDDDDSSTLLISTLHYTLSSTSLQSVRLIVVSKDSSSVEKYTDIVHYTDLIKTQLTNTYGLNLQPKCYKFVIEETNSSGVVTCRPSEAIDLTTLQARPTTSVTNTYRNSIVLTTNIDVTSNYLTLGDTFNFVVDAYDLSTNCSELITLSNTNTDVYVVDNKYELHLCDLSVNTNYLIVYHVEYPMVDNNMNITNVITKDSDEVDASTTNDGPNISNLTIEYYPSGSYPDGSTDPTGFYLSWSSAEDTIFDPSCQDQTVESRYKIERKLLADSNYTLVTDVSGTSNLYWNDTTGLVAGNVYTYRITAGLYDTTTQIVEYIPSIPTQNVPYYTKPDALVVDITNKEVGPIVDTFYVNSTDVTVTWTSPTLNGYQILNNTIHIEDDDEDVLISTGTYTFSGLINGTTYIKNFSFDVVNSNWYDLVENTTSPYLSYTTTKTFIPYGDLDNVSNIRILLDPEYSTHNPTDFSATGTLLWNTVESCGLSSNVTYYVTIRDASSVEIAINPDPDPGDQDYDNYETTSTSMVFKLVQRKNYIFEVYAKQTAGSIIKTSTPQNITAPIRTQSSAVQSLSVNYKESSYSLPSSGVEVAPFNTSVTDVNYIKVSASKPAYPSWPVESFYKIYITSVIGENPNFQYGANIIGYDTDTITTSNSLFNTTTPYNFDATTIPSNNFIDGIGLTNGNTYTYTITPWVDVGNFLNFNGPSIASTNFTFYKVPTVSNVSLVVNNDESMTIEWETDLEGNYDVYLKDLSSNDSPVFKGRVSGSTRTLTILNTTTPALVAGQRYVAYVRPWATINSLAYINTTDDSNAVFYTKQPVITLPTTYNDKSSTDPTILTETHNLNPTITTNGATNIHYELRYISYTSEGNTDTIISNHEYSPFDLGGTSPTSTDPVNDYSELPLTSLGYYKFKLYITQYTDPNTGSVIYLSDELNNLISSNSSDFFYKSIPSIISSSITGIPGTDPSYNYTLRVDAYNNWSNITQGLAVIIPRNPSSFTGETLKLFNGTDTTIDNNNSSSNSVKLQYFINNDLTDRATFVFGGITSTYEPITKKFIVITNGVGLTYYTDA